jgi:UDP-N-acetylmuramate dehydrogenase
MMSALRDVIPEQFLANVRFDEPLSRHTSWHVGGPADAYYMPQSADELGHFLAALPQRVPIHWLGLGSNVLIRDGGLRGVVVSLLSGLSNIEWQAGTVVHADAGVLCAVLARQCIKWNLGPAEFLAGIPGTIGGALAMNAGAWGGETWNNVIEVDVITRAGTRHTRPASDYKIAYRSVGSPVADEWFLGARFDFPQAPSPSPRTIDELLTRRRETQPIGAWSGGSTFTNPQGHFAAELIECSGLKGCRQGDAVVSPKHANFIVNEGQATAADIEFLMAHVTQEVERQQGVRLVPEVRILGEKR